MKGEWNDEYQAWGTEARAEDLGCEDPNLVESGVSKVFRVGEASTNPGGRDINIRFCEQKTAGGGWTVSDCLIICTSFRCEET